MLGLGKKEGPGEWQRKDYGDLDGLWMGLVVKVTGLGKMDRPGKEVAGGSETRWG